MRSILYDHFDVLCLKNTRTGVGWLLCRQVSTNCCTIFAGIRHFDPKSGTTSLLKHVRAHKSNAAISHAVQLSLYDKRRVIESAVDAVVHSLLPLSFSYKKKGIMALARVLIEIGQSSPPTAEVYVDDLMPSKNAVLNGVKRVAGVVRKELKEKGLEKICAIGGGVTCDGPMQPVTGQKYYDLVVHYVEMKKHVICYHIDIKLHSRVLLLNEHSGPESAENIHANLNNALSEKFGISFSGLMRNFTFVTDWTATLPCVVGASASSSRFPLSSKWIGCVFNQLNTILKHTISEEIIEDMRIAKDLGNIKELVCIIKAGAWNNELPDGCALIPECETRFGTTFEVVQRFLHTAPFITVIVSAKNSQSARNAVISLLSSVDLTDNFVTYAALQAIVDVFAGVRHMQNAMKASSYPIIHHVLPMWKSLVRDLFLIASGFARGSNFITPH